MANRIKGVTVEIGGDTTKLSKALESVNKNIKGTQSQLKDVEKLLKLDPTNTELLSQKQKLLAQNISSTSDKLETLKTANEQAAKSAGNYDAWKEKYDPIKSEIAKTQEKLKDLKEQSKQADEQLAKGEISQEKYDRLQDKIKNTSDDLKALQQSAKDVSKEFGNPISPEQYDALQREIIETENELKNLQQEFENTQPSDTLQREIVETENELEKLQDEAEKSKTAMEKISETGKKMQKVGDKISGIGKKLMPVTTGITAVGTAAVKTGADFDAEMSKVEAITGEVADEDLPTLIEAAEEMGLSFEYGADSTETAMNIIRAKARQMGSQTKYSASEAGQAFEYMAMAGWKPYDMLNGISGVLDLAAASNEELGTTSDIVTDALTAFGLKAEDAGHFSDVLAATSSNANTNVSILGESFKYCAPIAGAMSASVEDVALALGLMANSGIKGSQAGNALKNGLTNLTGVSKKCTKEMEALGLMTTETVNVIDQSKVDKAQIKVENKTLDLEKAQIAYNQALEKYSTDSTQVQTASANVEKAQISLNDAISKYGEDSSQARKAALTLEQAQNKLTDTMAQCGKNSPEVQKALLNLQKAENNLTDAQNDLTIAQQGTWEETGNHQSILVDEYGNMKSLGEIMDILREKMGGVDVAFTDSEGNLRSYEDIIADLEQTEEGLTQAEQLKSAAVLFGKDNLAGMLAVINASEEDYNKLRNAIYDCDGTAGDMAETMQDNLEGQLTILKSQLEELAISFSDILMPTIREIVSKFQAFSDKLNSMSPEMKETIVKIALLVAAIAPVLIVIGKIISAVGTILTIIPKVANAIKLVKIAMMALNGTFLTNPIFLVTAAVTALVAGFIYLWNHCEGFRNFWIGLWEEIQNTLYKFFDAWKSGWATITEFFSNIWNGIKDFFSIAWNNFHTNFQTGMDIIKASWTDSWTKVNDFFTNILNSIKNFFTNTWSNFQTNFQTGMNTIKTTVSNTMNNIKNNIFNIWNNIKSGVSEKVTGIKNTIVDGFNNAVNFVKNLANEAWTWGTDIIDNIVNGIRNKISDLVNTVSDVANTIWEYLHFSVPEKGALTDFESWMPDFMTGLADGIRKNQKYVENAVNDVSEAMRLTMDSDINYTLNGVSSGAMAAGTSAGTVNNYYNTDNRQTFHQTNNSPKALSRFDIYRQTNNILSKIKKV